VSAAKRAFGLSEVGAVRYYIALKMAEKGLVSAPNMAVGEPFHIGITPVGNAIPGMPQLGDSQNNDQQGAHAAPASG
jgi:hypothetical protein